MTLTGNWAFLGADFHRPVAGQKAPGVAAGRAGAGSAVGQSCVSNSNRALVNNKISLVALKASSVSSLVLGLMTLAEKCVQGMGPSLRNN